MTSFDPPFFARTTTKAPRLHGGLVSVLVFAYAQYLADQDSHAVRTPFFPRGPDAEFHRFENNAVFWRGRNNAEFRRNSAEFRRSNVSFAATGSTPIIAAAGAATSFDPTGSAQFLAGTGTAQSSVPSISRLSFRTPCYSLIIEYSHFSMYTISCSCLFLST